MEVTLRPIGTVRGGRVDPVDDGWGSEVSTIELDPRRLDADALVGLDEFSHVEVGSYTVVVRGLDAVDGSPVLDLKPYLRGFAPRGEVVEPRWATEIMAGYWEAAEDRTGA